MQLLRVMATEHSLHVQAPQLPYYGSKGINSQVNDFERTHTTYGQEATQAANAGAQVGPCIAACKQDMTLQRQQQQQNYNAGRSACQKGLSACQQYHDSITTANHITRLQTHDAYLLSSQKLMCRHG